MSYKPPNGRNGERYGNLYRTKSKTEEGTK